MHRLFLLLVCIFVCAMEAINRQSWIRAHTHHLSNAQPNKKRNSLFLSLRLVRFYREVKRCCVGVG
jgi:cell division protein FtsL